tara:strand:+ start:1128 stop:1388 length:261 start_codon:yes stop_codon:yes gene_type:complete
METILKIETPVKERDYFPSTFTNKDNSIIILADERTSDKTFSGQIIHSTNNHKKSTLGVYSTGWTYTQFTRLPKGSKITLTINQDN